MSKPLWRAVQRPSGIWAIDFEDEFGRHRITTGIKTEPLKGPPAHVKAALLPTMEQYWRSKGLHPDQRRA